MQDHKPLTTKLAIPPIRLDSSPFLLLFLSALHNEATVGKVMLPPFLVIFYGQGALSTPFPTAITTIHVIAALDIPKLLRIDFISVSISSDTRGGLPTFFIEKSLNFFLC